MTSPGVRLARFALLGLLAAVAGWVAWTLRSPPEEPEPAVEEVSPAQPAEARMGELVIRSFDEGEQDYEIKARNMLGREQEQVRLEDVALRFAYVSEGEPAEGTVTSRECLYHPERQEALFEGDVVVSTADGLELRTESLTYRGSSGLALSDDPVAFDAEPLSGTPTGLAYHSRTATLNLPADVVLALETESRGTIHIRSDRAILHQREGRAVFQDAVQVVREGEVLTAERLVIFGTRERAERIRAVQDVVLTVTGEVASEGLPSGAGSGRRELRAHQLDATFRPEDGSLEEVVGSYGAELTLYPGPGDPQEIRRLSGRVLTFRWDEQRRLYEAQGQRDTEVRVEPAPGSSEPSRTLRSRSFVVLFDKETGDVARANFQRDVVLTRGSQIGRGGRAFFDAGLGAFSLREDPRLEDREQGSELVAELIEFQQEGGGVEARGDVRHTLRPSAERRGGLLEEEGVPTVIRSDSFHFDQALDLATYTGEPALLRRGEDEVRAPVIRLGGSGGEARRLEAEGGVVTLLHPERDETDDTNPEPGPAADAVAEPVEAVSTDVVVEQAGVRGGESVAERLEARNGEAAADGGGVLSGDVGPHTDGPMEGRAESLSYDEKTGEVRYTGDVELTQGNLQTRAPEAILTLVPDSRRLERMEAGDPVEIVQGERRASGARATWSPAEGTVVIVGPSVVLEDPTQRVEGRSLTFNIAEDTILVDGRDRARTETVFR